MCGKAGRQLPKNHISLCRIFSGFIASPLIPPVRVLASCVDCICHLEHWSLEGNEEIIYQSQAKKFKLEDEGEGVSDIIICEALGRFNEEADHPI